MLLENYLVVQCIPILHVSKYELFSSNTCPQILNSNFRFPANLRYVHLSYVGKYLANDIFVIFYINICIKTYIDMIIESSC